MAIELKAWCPQCLATYHADFEGLNCPKCGTFPSDWGVVEQGHEYEG